MATERADQSGAPRSTVRVLLCRPGSDNWCPHDTVPVSARVGAVPSLPSQVKDVLLVCREHEWALSDSDKHTRLCVCSERGLESSRVYPAHWWALERPLVSILHRVWACAWRFSLADQGSSKKEMVSLMCCFYNYTDYYWLPGKFRGALRKHRDS